MYPNPTKSDITISFKHDIDASILLKDINGKLLSSTTMQGERSKTISLLVPAGVYFLHTVSSSGNVLGVNKIVVAK